MKSWEKFKKADGIAPMIGAMDLHTSRAFVKRTISLSTRGASAVVALSLVAAMMFFTIGISTTMITTLHNTSSSKKALLAEYAAQSGVEMVNLALAGMEPGMAAGNTGTVCVKKSGGTGKVNATCDDTDEQTIGVDYTITGQDNSNETVYISPFSGYRSVPILGMGNAGENCRYPNPLADDPCNWNRIYYGDSVEIPLYVISGDGSVKNFSNLGISDFKIRVRTPCTSADCSSRYLVQAGAGVNAILVSWVISGNCNGVACSLTQISNRNDPEYKTSAITEEDLDDGSTDTVNLSAKGDKGNGDPYVTISSFLAAGGGSASFKPILKLSFIKDAVASNGVAIPYLEYQILYSGGALAAMYKIDVDGYAEGFKYSLEGVQGIGSVLFDFAVQN